MKWIKMPKKISLSRPSSIIAIMSEINKDIYLDWKETTEVLPSGLAILSCLLDSIREKGFKVQSKNIKKEFLGIPVIQSLQQDKIKKILTPSLVDINGANYILRGFETSYPVGLIEAFKTQCPNLLVNEDLEYECGLILSELIQNTIDHSTGERFYIAISGSDRDHDRGIRYGSNNSC